MFQPSCVTKRKPSQQSQVLTPSRCTWSPRQAEPKARLLDALVAGKRGSTQASVEKRGYAQQPIRKARTAAGENKNMDTTSGKLSELCDSKSACVCLWADWKTERVTGRGKRKWTIGHCMFLLLASLTLITALSVIDPPAHTRIFSDKADPNPSNPQVDPRGHRSTRASLAEGFLSAVLL